MSTEDSEGTGQLQLEIDWCVARLEERLETCAPGSRNALEAEKVLRILRSSKAPLVKKRQAMRNTFGDYRQKIRAMQKKATAAMKKTQFVQGKTTPEASKFLRHSTLSSSHRQTASSEPSATTEQSSPVETPDDSHMHVDEGAASCSMSAAGDNGRVEDISDKPLNCAETGPKERSNLQQDEEASSAGMRFQFRPSQNEFRFNFGAEKLKEPEESENSAFVMRPSNSGNAFQFKFSVDGASGHT